jgi:hypothetical protein
LRCIRLEINKFQFAVSEDLPSPSQKPHSSRTISDELERFAIKFSQENLFGFGAMAKPS